MTKINAQDLLDEIRFDIKEKDLIKAKLVLSALKHVSRKVQKQALFEVSRSENDFAIPLLAGVIAENPDVTESFPQLKETLFSKITGWPGNPFGFAIEYISTPHQGASSRGRRRDPV